MSALADILSGVGYVLDTPGALARGVLARRPGTRASGEELLQSFGWDDPGFVPSLLTEIIADPTNLIGGGVTVARGLKGRAAKAFNREQQHLLDMGGMPEALARETALVHPPGTYTAKEGIEGPVRDMVADVVRRRHPEATEEQAASMIDQMLPGAVKRATKDYFEAQESELSKLAEVMRSEGAEEFIEPRLARARKYREALAPYIDDISGQPLRLIHATEATPTHARDWAPIDHTKGWQSSGSYHFMGPESEHKWYLQRQRGETPASVDRRAYDALVAADVPDIKGNAPSWLDAGDWVHKQATKEELVDAILGNDTVADLYLSNAPDKHAVLSEALDDIANGKISREDAFRKITKEHPEIKPSKVWRATGVSSRGRDAARSSSFQLSRKVGPSFGDALYDLKFGRATEKQTRDELLKRRINHEAIQTAIYGSNMEDYARALGFNSGSALDFLETIEDAVELAKAPGAPSIEGTAGYISRALRDLHDRAQPISPSGEELLSRLRPLDSAIAKLEPTKHVRLNYAYSKKPFRYEDPADPRLVEALTGRIEDMQRRFPQMANDAMNNLTDDHMASVLESAFEDYPGALEGYARRAADARNQGELFNLMKEISTDDSYPREIRKQLMTNTLINEMLRGEGYDALIHGRDPTRVLREQYRNARVDPHSEVVIHNPSEQLYAPWIAKDFKNVPRIRKLLAGLLGYDVARAGLPPTAEALRSYEQQEAP